MPSFQELADEAFLDLLAKHHRPTDFREALRANAPETGKSAPRRRSRPERLSLKMFAAAS